MLDPKLIRNHPEHVATQLLRRGYELDVALLSSLEEGRKALQTELQSLQNQRNLKAKAIGQAKAKKLDCEALLLEATHLGAQFAGLEQEFNQVQQRLEQLALEIPNLPHDSVPEGQTEDENVELKRVGVQPRLDSPQDHINLGALHQSIDFEVAAKLSGARFTVLKHHFARLHRALGQFMIDLHSQEHGYTEIYGPYLVNTASLYGTGQLPKFAEDQFSIKDHDLSLIPTAEVMLTNLVRDEILDGKTLPLKMVSLTPCFRSEAGAYGKDARGMFRQHQFDKVELVMVTTPDNSYACLEALVGHAERVLQLLELPYRVMSLCGGDMGFGAAKTYDIEVWLPGQQRYREISSCSNMESFQARRLQARWRNPTLNKTEYLHTLNGSGLAVGRTLIAVLENYQTESGDIMIPDVLRPYMNGETLIKR